MPRPWTWITPTLAPLLILLSLLIACQYVLASSSKNVLPLANADLRARHLALQTSSVMSTTFDTILLQKVFPTDGAYPNGQVVYTMRVTHTHMSAVSNLILTSTVSSQFIPTESFAVGASITELTTYPTYTWRIDNLQPGGQAVVYVIGIVDPTQNEAGTITNFSTVAGAQDPNPTNNSVQLSLPITVPQITLNSYTVTTNEGSSNAAIDIEIDTPNPYGQALIDYATVEQGITTSATSGLDYVPISGTIIISAAQSSQRFFIPILDDSIDENLENIELLLSNPRGVNLGASAMLTVTIIDDDGASVLVDPLNLALTEDGPTQAYSITLTSQPLAPVNIILDSNPQTALSSNMITFTAANWDQPQIVSVSAIDNRIDDGDRYALVTHQVDSQDPVYDNRPVSDVSINIIDNDDTAIIVSSTAITTAEGTYTTTNLNPTYSIVLNSEPVAPVHITLRLDPQLQTDSGVITFTTQNWSVPQIVTVEAQDDMLAEGVHMGTIAHDVTSTDANYAGAAVSDISVKVEDNDNAALLFSSTILTTTEGSSFGVYSVTLATKPFHTVTVTSLTNDAELITDPDNLLFSTENWNIPQTITLTAVDDTMVENLYTTHIEHQISSDDPLYNVVTGTVFVNIEDNDSAGLLIETSILKITEGVTSSSQPLLNSTNIYDITLVSQPTEIVTVTLVISDQLKVEPTQLFFAPAEWDQHQTISVEAPEDNVVRGNQLFTITHQLTSDDLHYNSITNELVTQVIDNDKANVQIGAHNNTTLREGVIASNEYTITLSSQPTTPVTITLSTNEQVVVEPAIIVFTDQNWSEPQEINLTPTDDDEAELDQEGVVTYTVSSSDENYDNLNIIPSRVPIIDDDQSTNIYLPIVDK